MSMLTRIANCSPCSRERISNLVALVELWSEDLMLNKLWRQVALVKIYLTKLTVKAELFHIEVFVNKL